LEKNCQIFQKIEQASILCKSLSPIEVLRQPAGWPQRDFTRTAGNSSCARKPEAGPAGARFNSRISFRLCRSRWPTLERAPTPSVAAAAANRCGAARVNIDGAPGSEKSPNRSAKRAFGMCSSSYRSRPLTHLGPPCWLSTLKIVDSMTTRSGSSCRALRSSREMSQVKDLQSPLRRNLG